MKTGFWIAGRYSFARKRFRVINIISGISLGGIIVGVSTLLIVMSVLNGFQKLARDLFLTIESPVQLVPVKGSSIALPSSLLESLRRLDGVSSVQPFAEGKALLSTPEHSELIMVKGLTDEAQARLMRETHHLTPYFTADSISAGELLAYRLQLTPYSRITLFSPELISAGLESLEQPELLPALSLTEARVGSVFTLQKIFDDRYVLTTAQMARQILLLGNERYSGIDLRAGKGVSDAELEQHVRKWLSVNRLEERLQVRTLEEKYHDMFAVMQLEKWASFSVLMLVIMVAVLSLTGSLAMTVIDKQHELFYLRCLGLERPQFMTIFIVEGGLTGLVGTAIGSAVAWCLCRAQDLYGIVHLPSKSAFIIATYPVSMKTGDFVAVAVSTVALCLLVSLYPAGKAAAIATSRSLENKTN
jgi:lipoprotein-releasing system permease protein